MSNIVAEDLTNCPEAMKCHWYKVRIWPSGDVVFSKQTKRCALNLTNPAKLRKPRPTRGLKGLTTYGRKVVRSAAQLLSRKWKKENLSFITATVPDLSDCDLEKLVDGWGAIAHRFCDELQRELLRKGIKTQYLYVTEIQPKRWEATQQAYPHLHMVLRGRLSTSHSWGLTTAFMSRVWKRVLEKHLGLTFQKSPVTQIRRIEKSVVNYLSKYMSKGLGSLSGWTSNQAVPPLPSAWYGLSRTLLELVRSLTFEVREENLRAVLWHLETCFHLNKATCSVMSLLDQRTGFMWPVAMTGYIYDRKALKVLYDSIYDGKHPI